MSQTSSRKPSLSEGECPIQLMPNRSESPVNYGANPIASRLFQKSLRSYEISQKDTMQLTRPVSPSFSSSRSSKPDSREKNNNSNGYKRSQTMPLKPSKEDWERIKNLNDRLSKPTASTVSRQRNSTTSTTKSGNGPVQIPRHLSNSRSNSDAAANVKNGFAAPSANGNGAKNGGALIDHRTHHHDVDGGEEDEEEVVEEPTMDYVKHEANEED